MTDLEWFNERWVPEPNTGCWLWTATMRGKYGVFARKPHRRIQAHRWSYQHFVGPLTDGLVACHKCDTPLCVNPQHLFAGTSRDNVQDAIRKCRRKRVNDEFVASSRARGRILRQQKHCKYGHEYREENTYWKTNGCRQCRECMRIYDRQRRPRKRVA